MSNVSMQCLRGGVIFVFIVLVSVFFHLYIGIDHVHAGPFTHTEMFLIYFSCRLIYLLCQECA